MFNNELFFLLVLESFATITGVLPVRTVNVGDSLVLNCDPPYSYPSGVVYWGLTGTFNEIEVNERITIDYDGKCHDIYLLIFKKNQFDT